MISPRELLDQLNGLPRGERHLVALAGPPGAGKSTLAAALKRALNKQSQGRAAVVGMDGFHLDNSVLTQRGDLSRKGAPHTFDVGGLAAMLYRLRANAESEIFVPVFDRSIEVARAGAGVIERQAEVVLIEGNYILASEPPWSVLWKYFHLRVLIQVDETELSRRLVKRWQRHSLMRSEIDVKIKENDLPNGRYVYENCLGFDIELDGTQALGHD